MTDGSLGSATRSGVAWTTTSFVAGRLATFVAMIVLARLLAPADFGVVAAITTYLTFIELASDLGMKATVVYEQERGITNRVETAFTFNLGVAVLLTAVGVALAPLVAGFFDMSEETDLFRLAALNLLLSGLANIHDSLLLRELAFRRRAVPELARAAVRGTVAVVLAAFGLGAEALVIGMLAGTAAWAMLQWVLTAFRPAMSFDRSIARSMIPYGAGAASLEVLSVVTSRVDTIVVARVLGSGPLGLYSVAFRIPELAIDSIAWNLSKVAFPALSKIRTQSAAGVAVATLTLLRFQALFGVAIGTGVAILATPLVVVLFGEQWEPAGGVMSALAVMSAVHACVFPLGDALKATARQRLIAMVQLIELPILVGALIAAAPAGIVAVAWVRAGVMVLHATLMLAVGRRVLAIPIRSVLRATRPALIAATGVAIGAGAVRLAWPVNTLLPLLCGIAAGTAGAVAALRLGAPDVLRTVLAEFRRLAPGRAG